MGDILDPLMSSTVQTLRARVAELESALAKSASREAELVEKLGVATGAMDNLVKVKGRFHTEQAYAGIVAALAKIREAS